MYAVRKGTGWGGSPAGSGRNAVSGRGGSGSDRPLSGRGPPIRGPDEGKTGPRVPWMRSTTLIGVFTPTTRTCVPSFNVRVSNFSSNGLVVSNEGTAVDQRSCSNVRDRKKLLLGIDSTVTW